MEAHCKANYVGLQDLPVLVMEKLVEFLDYGSRKTCRLVSRTLKNYVEDIGLAIKIDSREPDCMDFCGKVNVTEAHVLYLKGNLNDKEWYVENWKISIFSGPIDTNLFFNCILRNCSNLRILMIRGKCLVSQDFNSPSTPLPIFQHLKEVHIIVSLQVFFGAVNKFGPFRTELKRSNTIRKMDTRVQKNAACLLKSIRSRVLKLFFGHIGVHLEDSEQNIQWEHQPLFEFIEAHRNTLELLLLPGTIFSEPPPPLHTYRIPANLKLFSSCCAYQCSSRTYWKDLLLAQTSLEKLSLVKIQDEVETVLYLLRSVFANSAQTLTHIDLDFLAQLPSLDMKMLQSCGSLTSLAIQGNQTPNRLTIYNLNHLPRRCLKCLTLNLVSVGPDFDGVKFMDGFYPRTLYMLTISVDGFFGDPIHVAEFIQLLLRCRTLNLLGFTLNSNSSDFQGRCLPKRSMNDHGLILWMSVNRAEPEERKTAPGYLHYTYIEFLDIANHGLNRSSGTYVEAKQGVEVDYLSLTSSFKMTETLEQPFQIPRTAHSYTVLMNQRTQAYQFRPNY